MRVFRRIVPLMALAMTMAGCAGPSDRHSVIEQLAPAPMSDQAYAQARGTYTGPVRATSQRGGFEGESSTEVRVDVSGWADDPQVELYMDKGFSTAWAMYGERKGFYTNVPSKRYGAQGDLFASTHAPNQLLIKIRRFGLSPWTGPYMILTFQPGGVIDVDYIGHSGWRGDGELWRSPALQRAE